MRLIKIAGLFKSAISFLMVAGLTPKRYLRAITRDPTGSPVSMYFSTTALEHAGFSIVESQVEPPFFSTQTRRVLTKCKIARR
jgi:hypothetical protein